MSRRPVFICRLVARACVPCDSPKLQWTPWVESLLGVWCEFLMNSAFTIVFMLRQHDVFFADRLNGRTGVFGRFFPTKFLVLKKNNFNCPQFWPVSCVMTSGVHPPISRARARAKRLSKTGTDITVHREHTMQPKLGCLLGLGEEQAREGKSGTMIHSPAALATLRLRYTSDPVGSSATLFFSKNRYFFHKFLCFFEIFLNLVCLFLVPVTRASAHAWHVFLFVVSRFSAGNYLDNNLLYPHNI